ncbi:site-specific integrase [Burkholderia sp. PAMC 26561]|uniref:site-specific integrase n=1 Tax=Burkholderia sp. PAMC 26561 TaxID=1795043 RepID=UPI00076B0A58|nr:site-specific integrase [Burkholderia sp. PAMC 26561]AME28110.1 hypothetical protein AXG89_30040 [Burkholderia sp. PAMC 26561]
MKPRKPTKLGRCLLRFFRDFLPTLRGVSVNTIRSYPDAVVLLLRFISRESGRPIQTLALGDLNADHVKRFLKLPESERGNTSMPVNMASANQKTSTSVKVRFWASFESRVGGLLGQVRAQARRSEY